MHSFTVKRIPSRRFSRSQLIVYHRLRFQLSRRYQSTEPITFKETPRINPVGIQHLSKSLHAQLFGNKKHSLKEESMTTEERANLINLSKQLLKNHGLLGKKTSISEPISFELPKLQGNSLDEHFQKLGHFASEPYKTMALNKFTTIIPKPLQWVRTPGWTRYEPNKKPEQVPYPKETTIVFDVETMYKLSPYPTLATAVSDKAWYSWCSPYICDADTTNDSDEIKHLVPLGDNTTTPRLIIGHNVGYDRARVLEEYNFKPSKTFFLDTQSLHVATSGLCSRQRPMFVQMKKKRKLLEEEEAKVEESMRTTTETEDTDGITGISTSSLNNLEEEEDPWLNVSTMNSLSDVALFHCGIKMDKEPRDYFASLDKTIVVENFQKLMTYCSDDVDATSRVFDKVLRMFLKKCPHPVSFGALRALSSFILPTTETAWNNYIQNAEELYQNSKLMIENKIIESIEELVKLKDDSEKLSRVVPKDPWLRQLDWTMKPIRMTKKGVPVKGQKLPGYPEWYRSLFANKDSKTPQITIKSRSIPIFFKLSWEDHPVVWTKESGWCFPVHRDEFETFKSKNYIIADEDSIAQYRRDTNSINEDGTSDQILLKVPHPNGPAFNCTTLLSKPYIHFFEKGVLKSDSELAHQALNMNSSGSYWMAARERIKSQFVVSRKDFPDQFQELSSSSSVDAFNEQDNLAIILPTVIPMGTVTRRAVENTWLTASNAKGNRIGSELKTLIKAPKGYCFVGADVDSEELWIASLVGDSVFNIHGGTAIGWMCLEGTKNEGTDLHTKTAQILGCSRNEAKIFNYGRIYGAGVKFAGQLLKRFNPSLGDEEAKETAIKLYENTKGKTKRSKIFKKFWFGGSESILFNKLESIAEQDEAKTPVLGCGITTSLMKRNLKSNSFLPSRINWAIQSSGVDYLHLLCCSMTYLIAKYNLNARLTISIHDEIRYLASEKDKYKVAMALQISNIWTRAIFCEQMGIDDLPQNCAFFSAVDIDHVMRKEVDMDCTTPSNKVPIPHGENLDIIKLLAKPESLLIDPDSSVDVSQFSYKYREPVFSEYNRAYSKDFWKYFLKMQVQDTKWKVDSLENSYLKEATAESFHKNGYKTEYGLLDYLRDVKGKKIRKKNIMENSFLTDYSVDVQPIKIEPTCSGEDYNILHSVALSNDTGNMKLKNIQVK
ncbi:DNA-directed DNA polymerase gamma MIP1 NDAI_0E03810 [Naumovozyma dairenensis CBS 421]|uniref:DNA polymerase gamma n=1 Tax=Naumovozyma dairenensis (strain ATCC 10597 / BCRC 20456 / CBS 421 / NBRC 0211 / NRRL Y-12639) TaxID=1071378 RepID=G0WBS8_NAUDC|nr:hypothetical protein NDAI_0E03810 [Naumovozyma dairenensis CBS 421]CCD25198.1 hypothetical protein NDAI_0E03810 [Naumovozyma dairenensis CBS 421]